jgi:hypothetical protein
VRYAITWDRDPPPPGWIEIARQKGSILLENRNVLPRAFVPAAVRLSAPNALEEMARETDFGTRAWIETGSQPADAANGPGRVLHIEESPREYALDADLQSAGWIVTSILACVRRQQARGDADRQPRLRQRARRSGAASGAALVLAARLRRRPRHHRGDAPRVNRVERRPAGY